MAEQNPYVRIAWHSRRGLLELDLVLVPFCEQHFDGLSEDDKQRYAALLRCEDQDLLEWMLGRAEPADPELAQIVALIRERHNAR